MNERKLFQNGITLIALVISIIVMLILAGVSLNATIGDNGIITQAQNATYMQSVAVLEEFLQTEYVKYYDEVEKYDNKLDGLINEPNTKKYFQRAKNSSYFFLDTSSYKEYYFIEKSALPEEIAKQLKGGENSLTGKGIYADFEDIYGVTSDLEIYYCSKNNDNRIGATDTAKTTELSKVVFSKDKDSDWLKVLGKEDDITLNDIRTITSITISDSNIDLTKISNLGSLKEINFVNVQKENLEGLQDAINLDYIYFQNCKINDYSALKKVSKLKTLYLLLSNNNINANEQLATLCDSTKGIGETDLSNLYYFGIFGCDPIYQNTFTHEQASSVKSNLNDISCLNNLSKNTKESIKYLLINNNKIANFDTLKEFKNIYLLRGECNDVTTLNGLQDMTNLRYLFVNGNKLGDNETEKNEENALVYLKNNNNLYYINLKYNINLKYVSYLSKYTTIRELYLTGCENMNADSLYAIVNIINNCGSNCSIPSKYTLLLLNENTSVLDLSNQTLSEENFKLIKNYKKINTLKLNNLNLVDSSNNKLSASKINIILNDTLKELTELKYLSLYNISSLSTIEFTKDLKKLVEIDLRNTNATDLTLLNNITTMRQFLINNENIDITKIQPTISRCSGSTGLYDIWSNCGISLGGKEKLLKQLENCTEITSLSYAYQDAYNANNQNYTLDLTNCTKLTSIRMNKPGLYTVKLPTSVKTIDFYYQSANGFTVYPDLSSLSNLEKITINASGLNPDGYNNLFRQLSGNQSLKYFYDDEFGNYGVVSIPQNINLPNLLVLSLDYWSNNINSNNLDITGLYTANLPNLQELYLRGQSIKSLEGIEDLTSLKKLYLQENKITSIKQLLNLKNLEELNLEDNVLYDNYQEKDENGNVANYRNLDIIKNLNKANGGSLQKIYLDNNNNITDWSIINKLKWTDKSGF